MVAVEAGRGYSRELQVVRRRSSRASKVVEGVEPPGPRFRFCLISARTAVRSHYRNGTRQPKIGQEAQGHYAEEGHSQGYEERS